MFLRYCLSLVCVYKFVWMTFPLSAIDAPFSKRSKLLQLLEMVMHPLSPLFQLSHLSSFSISLSSRTPASDGITSNSFLSLIFCTYNDGVASSLYSFSQHSRLSSLSSLAPIAMMLHPLSTLSLSTLLSLVFLIFCTYSDGAMSPLYSHSFNFFIFLLSLMSHTCWPWWCVFFLFLIIFELRAQNLPSVGDGNWLSFSFFNYLSAWSSKLACC